jgi:hypothetical protein
MQNVSNTMLISALFLPGLWLGLLLRPRHLPWAVPIAVVVAAAYCWVRFHKESVDFWLLMAMVPLLAILALGVFTFALGAGLTVGYLIRTHVRNIPLKAGAAILLTALAAVLVRA